MTEFTSQYYHKNIYLNLFMEIIASKKIMSSGPHIPNSKCPEGKQFMIKKQRKFYASEVVVTW